jgi:hypothetical protein
MTSETITENIFRGFYGSNTFLEKSAIRGEFGFISKKNPNSKNKGYPDFLNNDTILSLVSIWQLPLFNLNTNSSI